MSRTRTIVAATAALVLTFAAGAATASTVAAPGAIPPPVTGTPAAPSTQAPIAVALPSSGSPVTGQASASPPGSSPPPPLALGPGSPSTLQQGKRPPLLIEDFPRGSFHHPTRIDNAYLPLIPGTQMIYQGQTGIGKERKPHRVEFTVTDLTKVIDGIDSVVAFEKDFTDGALVEAEIIFYAQDDNGTVWLMGEYPEEYDGRKIVDSPAWVAGSRGSYAGILMQAAPAAETPSYSEGWGPEVGWTDRARILETGSETCVKFNCFRDVLVVNEYNPDTADAHQLKYYAPGIGSVRVGWMGSGENTQETLELVDIAHLDAAGMTKIRAAAVTLEQRAHVRVPQVFTGPPAIRAR
jgi:hypothetical protein